MLFIIDFQLIASFIWICNLFPTITNFTATGDTKIFWIFLLILNQVVNPCEICNEFFIIS